MARLPRLLPLIAIAIGGVVAVRAIGVAPRALAAAASISTTAAAASLMPEALPAVTVPFSLRKTGLSLADRKSVV